MTGLTLIHTAGHTPDHTVLHDAANRRVLFCGDAMKFTFAVAGADRRRARDRSRAHKAFDAHLPLTRGDVRRYRDLFEPLDFDAVVTPWEVVTTRRQGRRRCGCSKRESSNVPALRKRDPLVFS